MFLQRHMKPLFFSLSIFILTGVFAVPGVPAAEEKRATILFSGSFRGTLDPVHT